MLTLNKINEIAEQQGDQVSIVHYDEQLTWNQLKSQTERRVAYLINRYGGSMPKQACYICNNRIDLFPWLAAFATLSVPVVGIDYTLPLTTIQEMARKIGVDIILLSSVQLNLHGEMPVMGESHEMGSVLFDLDSPSMAMLDSIGENQHQLGCVIPPSDRAFRAIGFTSGTSGLPKAVLRSKSFDQRRFQYFSERYGFNRSDRFMVSMPMYHAAGNGWARLFMSLGATLYLVDSSDTEMMALYLDRYNITATVFSPVLLASVINCRQQNQRAKPEALKWVLVGGRNFTEVEKKRALDHLGTVIYEYYGTTESGVNAIAEPEDLLRHPQSVGRAYDGNHIVILSNNGDVLPAGQTGTVAIASYMTMDDYVEGGGQFIILNDGLRYFISPDQGYLDDFGRLFLLNRSGGSRQVAHLYQLENAIRELPCIDDVAMMMVDDSSGDKVQCIYSLKNKSSNSQRLLEKIKQVANDASVLLGPCKQIPHIPYTPSGKVRVSDLQKLIANS